MNYTKEETLRELNSIDEMDLSSLYQNKLINRSGITKDTKEPYTEVIISGMYDNGYIEHNAILAGIEEIRRKNSYYTPSHDELLHKRTEGSNRAEENYVKDLFMNNPFEAELGKPIDFQVPLKNKQIDTAGKIDLITYDEKTSTMYLVEVKAPISDETALRCCLEIQTYFQQIEDLEKFVDDFYVAKKVPNKDFKVELAVIVFEDSTPAKEFKDTSRVNLQKLVKDFNIKVCYAQ